MTAELYQVILIVGIIGFYAAAALTRLYARQNQRRVILHFKLRDQAAEMARRRRLNRLYGRELNYDIMEKDAKSREQ